MPTNQSLDPGARHEGAGGVKYLAFRLGDEEYGVDLVEVQEIVGMLPITPVPTAPHYLQGVVNLRGKIVPVVDLRAKLGISAGDFFTPPMCLIIAKAHGVDFAVPVDSVAEIVSIALSDVDPVPDVGGTRNEALLGVGKLASKVVYLLDLYQAVMST
jgi:purine-binding chemotaxis protein CheW